jgi:hypothetical protein
MNGQVERQPAAEQERAVEHQHAARAQVHVAGPNGPVGLDVPQRRQHAAGAARTERIEDLPRQGAHVEPIRVESRRVGAALLEPQRSGPEEVTG